MSSHAMQGEGESTSENSANSILRAAIQAARTKLLDRSLRNRLIHTNLNSTRARQIRVFDALSVQTFATLTSGKTMLFAPAQRGTDIENTADGGAADRVYVPPESDVDASTTARQPHNKLQTRLTPEGLQKRLLDLYFEAQTLEEEQGVNILYLALGFLEWREARISDVQRYAPLVLLPVELIRDGARDRFKIKVRQEDLLTNFSLQVWLKEQFSIDLPDLPDFDDLEDVGEYFTSVNAAIGARNGWKVHEDEIVLGFFSFAKFLLWRDLDPANWPSADHLLSHDILKKILLRTATDSEQDLPLIADDERLDERFPSKQLVHITEADSSQAVAIEEALAGKNLVIQGPPGTGKSQTIANLIAAAVYRGKRVLFIAEKMAALDVVSRRLTKAKLGSVCLELHSRKAAKTQVLEQIKQGIGSPVPPQWSESVFSEVDGNSRKLREYSDALHRRGGNGFTPFELIGKMALLRREGTPTPDFMLPSASDWTARQIAQLAHRVASLVDHVQLAGIPNRHVWRGVGIGTPDVLTQDRLRPVVDSFGRASSELAKVAHEAAKNICISREPTLSELPVWTAAFAHLSKKPSGFDAFIANDDVVTHAAVISEFLDSFEKLCCLEQNVGGYREGYEALRALLPPDRIAALWTHVATRPKAHDWFLIQNGDLEGDVVLSDLLPKLKRLYELRSKVLQQVIPAAIGIDWLETRKVLAAHGRSALRIFSKSYRSASKQLNAMLKSSVKRLADRLSLLDCLLEIAELINLQKKHEKLVASCGHLWMGAESDWTTLQTLADWRAIAVSRLGLPVTDRRDLFVTVDRSNQWPDAPSSQTAIVADLVELARLDRKTHADQTALSLLGSYWTWKSERAKDIRLALTWATLAAKFERLVRLRNPVVLAFAPQAAEMSKSLSNGQRALECQLESVRDATRLDLSIAFDGQPTSNLTPSFLRMLGSQYVENLQRITEWPPIRDDLAWLKEIGCHEISERIFDGRLEARYVLGTVLTLAHEAIWQRIKSSASVLEKTHGDELSAFVKRFREADIDRIMIAADQVARAHADQRPTGSAGAVGVLKDEIKKSRKLKPVRRLVEEAGEAIQRFKPVFLMSPLSVAQYLPPGQMDFDLCVIDEASQVRAEDALGAIARSKQLVVVGDDKQLPPTNFFNRMVSDDQSTDEESDSFSDDVRAAPVKDVESILNLCSRFPERMLKWHYRSEHPALIATSNRNFYHNQLMLPPSVITNTGNHELGLQFVQVQKGGYERGKTATNEIEADSVARAVLDHARNSPEKSIGIGTFSVAQRDCIRDRLEHWAAKHRELDEFIRVGLNREPLFVKNLENIQGDERDVIFISVGYGHDQDGRLTQQFGPIGREGGERRLNVLITRARQRCVVFSSIVAEDVKIEGAPKPGVAALQEFLKLAKDGFGDLPQSTSRGFDSDFEESVALAIRELGFEVHPQVGMAGFYVDLGIVDPRNDGRYLAGIECDGAAYHSSRYARDRDRLRQTILESRGWKIHRVWSTDWFYRQDREISKIKTLLGSLISSGTESENGRNVTAQASVADWPAPDDTFLDEGGPKFPPYRFVDLKWHGRHDAAPHDLDDARLADLVFTIVAAEQPIHTDEIGRRLASVFDLHRAGSRIQDAAVIGLKEAARRKRLIASKGFWRLADLSEVQPRDRSGLATAATVRKPELICPTEIAAAARIILRESLALDREELITEIARSLGFARTGPDVHRAIAKAISSQLAKEIEKDHLGRLRLLNESGGLG